jgi:hypothetical protein|nr:MAG TPA: hypothetical protein [Caudoviricetes sp.]
MSKSKKVVVEQITVTPTESLENVVNNLLDINNNTESDDNVISDEHGNEITSDEDEVTVIVDKQKTKVVRVTKDDLIKKFIKECNRAFGYEELEVSIFLIKRLAAKKSKTVLKTYLDELMLKLYRGELTILDEEKDE